MKKLIFLSLLLLVFITFSFKREIVLELLPVVINLNNPIAENKETEWAVGDIKDKTNKPNIILILADDMGFNDVSFYNGGAADGSLITPNIDNLAR